MIDIHELVLKAITFNHPARPPLFFRTDPERSDIVQAAFYAPTNFVDEAKTRDEWGCTWMNTIGTGTGYVVRHPFKNWGDFEDYQFPDPRLPSRFLEIEQAVQKYPGKFIVAGLGLSGFALMTALRGFEDVLTDFYLNPELISRLADRVFEFECAAIEEFARRGVHGVWFFDDWGTERNLFIRPGLWREFFKARYAAQFKLIHALGMKAFFHSCGCVWSVIPDFIEIGLDVLNLEQMLIFGDEVQTGYERVAHTYGDRLCFTVNVDTQRTLVNGTPQEIEQEILHIFDTFNRPEGGWIIFADAGKDHNIHPPENLRLVEDLFQSRLQKAYRL
jgi:uroporphyrinogen decarboxylase